MKIHYYFDAVKLLNAINETVRVSGEYRLEHSINFEEPFKIWFSSKGLYFLCQIDTDADGSVFSISAASPFSILTEEFEKLWNLFFLQQVEEIIHRDNLEFRSRRDRHSDDR